MYKKHEINDGFMYFQNFASFSSHLIKTKLIVIFIHIILCQIIFHREHFLKIFIFVKFRSWKTLHLKISSIFYFYDLYELENI